MPIDCKNCNAPCCRHAGLVSKELDRGDGTCKYLSWEGKCVIYSCRPFVCNTDRIYDKYFKDRIPREQFDKMNADACDFLRREDGNNSKQ